MRDLMLDIETLGTSYGSVVTQIGLLYFDRYSGKTGESLKINLNISDQLKSGLKVSADSLAFWFAQPKRTFLENTVTLLKGLQLVRDFTFSKSDLKVWAHATFDFPILEALYKITGQGFPFQYRRLRDIRTLVDLSGIDYKKEIKGEGVGDPKTHDALEDCYYQVKYCTMCFNKLKDKSGAL